MGGTGGLDIRGGTGGVSAELGDLVLAAGALDAVGDDLRHAAVEVIGLSASVELAASMLLSPGTGARAVASLAAVGVGPRGLLVLSAEVEATGHAVRYAAETYARVDAACAGLLEQAQQLAGIPFTLAFLTGTAAVTGAAALAGEGVEDQLVPAGPVADWLRGFARSHDGSVLQETSEQLFATPGMTEMAVGGVRAATAGGLALVGAPLGGGDFGSLGVRAAVAWRSTSYEDSVALLIATGSVFGAFDDGDGVRVQPVPPTALARAPGSVADILRQEDDLMVSALPGCVRVTQVTHPDGSSAWVVQLPGTQDWSVHGGSDPMDATSDVRLMAGQETALGRGVAQALGQAMQAAGVPPGQPVMLAGHSQGGILAAALAADPWFRRRFNVTHIVTAGSPISRIPVPPSVSVLALEQEQDAVPRLDQRRDPDRVGWVTVRRDVGGESHDLLGAHGVPGYVRTAAAVDRSRHPSVLGWRAGSRAFLTGHGVVRDYRLQRVPAPQAGAATGSCSTSTSTSTTAPRNCAEYNR